MGRSAKKPKKTAKNKSRKALAKPSVAPSRLSPANAATVPHELLTPDENQLNAQLELRLQERVRRVVEHFAKKYPDVNPEEARKSLAASYKKKLDQLEKRYPDSGRDRLLTYYTSRPDEQPLWFESGMDEKERKEIIFKFWDRAMKANMPPPLKGRDSHYYRAIRRQTRLTYKQWQVAQLTVEGFDIKAIAAQLKISDRMVKTQLQAIRRKANLSRNAEIVRWFLGY